MITDTDVFRALRTFLVRDVLPAGVEVLQAQQNRAPQPRGPNYVMLTAGSRTFQSSSYREYLRPDDQVDISRSTSVMIQLDFYGPDSGDHAQRFATLFRDDYGYQRMHETGVTPLYCDDGSQMPLTTSEKQYEARWMLSAVMQVTPVVSTPMQFADTVTPTLVKVD